MVHSRQRSCRELPPAYRSRQNSAGKELFVVSRSSSSQQSCAMSAFRLSAKFCAKEIKKAKSSTMGPPAGRRCPPPPDLGAHRRRHAQTSSRTPPGHHRHQAGAGHHHQAAAHHRASTTTAAMPDLDMARANRMVERPTPDLACPPT
jgi:hypothetical protein